MKSSFSSSPHHENFEELAALAAVGELSALEQERLRHHLAECPHCRETYEAFASMASNDLASVAADRESAEPECLKVSDAEAREQLQRLRNRLQTTAPIPESHTSPMLLKPGDRAGKNAFRVRRFAVYGLAAAALLAAIVAGAGYLWRMEKAVSAERARSHELQSVVDSLKQQRTNDRSASENAVLRSLEDSQKARDFLAKSLKTSETKNQELLARESASEAKLAGAIAAAEQLRQQLATNDGDRQRLAKLQQESDAKLHEALVELYQARQANAQVAAEAQAHEGASLEANNQPPSSASEMEARNLFGARDLHIVDVYDVNGEGKTKRTYGRVYYVEKKLLVFYAFDLQKRQNHKLAVFQAWGYREANVGKPLNLGLFTVDDGGASRWVLTVNRPDVLSHIDAVFVTVEPPGGSTAPRGKKVLYANLVGPPNHP
jgi:anti-sigma factor RsiW